MTTAPSNGYGAVVQDGTAHHPSNLFPPSASDDESYDSSPFHPAQSVLPPLTNASTRPSLSSLRAQLNRYYVVLFFAILAISCSGTLLRNLPLTPPLLKAFWRLLFMSGVLAVGAVYQWRTADEALLDHCLSNDAVATVVAGGLAASAHFGFWIWSLNHTSLAHSLFFVSAYPLVVVAIMLAQRKRIDRLEALGVLIGLVGSALLLADTSTSSAAGADEAEGTGVVQSVTFVGDVMAFLGAVVFVVYLYAGQRVRGWMPLFLYTCPMTFVSCVPLLLLTLLLEPVTFAGFTPQSVFGFLAPSSLVLLLLIAALPAGLGHTGINYAVKKVSPLSISVVLTLEPVLGVVVGVLAGVENVPGVLTIVGGPISMCGCIAAIVGTHRREQREKAVAELAQRITDQTASETSATTEHEDGERASESAELHEDEDDEEQRNAVLDKGAERSDDAHIELAVTSGLHERSSNHSGREDVADYSADQAKHPLRPSPSPLLSVLCPPIITVDPG